MERDRARALTTRSSQQARATGLANLNALAAKTLYLARVKWPVIIVMLIYIERMKYTLEVIDLTDAYVTVFVGSLVVASKVRAQPVLIFLD